MLRIFMSTVSYPVMNLSTALHNQTEARKTDEYKSFSDTQSKLRYKAIFKDRPFRPMFS